MIPARGLLIATAAVASFLIAACLVGAPVLILVVVYLIGPHGAGVLPEWSHLPFLVICAGGVGFVSLKVAFWVQVKLASRDVPSNKSLERTREG